MNEDKPIMDDEDAVRAELDMLSILLRRIHGEIDAFELEENARVLSKTIRIDLEDFVKRKPVMTHALK